MIRNLTPHTVIVLREDPDGDVTGFAGYGASAEGRRYARLAEYPSVGVARASTTTIVVGNLTDAPNVPVTWTRYGYPEGLPDYQRGTWLLVSLLTAQSMPDRIDLITVGETVRDAGGRIVGCLGFGTLNPSAWRVPESEHESNGVRSVV